jgi:threonine/homoserine/homoserine lactone efflux protein
MEYEKPIGLIGSAFLIFLGVFYVFFKKIKLQVSSEEPIVRFRKRDMAKIFSSGFLINTLNPNVFIFWLATATNFAIKYSFQQRMIIFTVCLALNIAADTFKVLMAGKLRSRLTLHNISVINKISGTLLIGFGVALLLGTIFLSEKIN